MCSNQNLILRIYSWECYVRSHWSVPNIDKEWTKWTCTLYTGCSITELYVIPPSTFSTFTFQQLRVVKNVLLLHIVGWSKVLFVIVGRKSRTLSWISHFKDHQKGKWCTLNISAITQSKMAAKIHMDINAEWWLPVQWLSSQTKNSSKFCFNRNTALR